MTDQFAGGGAAYEGQAVSIGENLPLIRWLLSHAGDVPDLIEAVLAVKTANGVMPRWTAIKAVGDMIVPWIAEAQDKFMAPMAATSADVMDLEQHEAVKLNPAILTLIISHMAEIKMVISLIYDLFFRLRDNS